MTPKDTFTVDYPAAVEFRNKQASIFWPPEEVKVEKDVQDILVNMTEAERHAVITVLRLFVKYELIIGDDFWANYVMKKFPRPDIQSMASLFSAIELSVHAPFYAKLNEELKIATDEFYNSYKEDPVLKDRIQTLEKILTSDDELYSLGAFTFAEGAVLYSSFAFLKHFQSQGKNKLLNVVSGINFSARDEALHSEASGWLFQQLLKEKRDAKEINEEQEAKLEEAIKDMASIVYEHEQQIITKLFEQGDIEGVSAKQLEYFVQSRINICMRNMGYNNIYEIKYNPIADWFYKGINGYAMNDFFNSIGNQYERGWTAEEFSF
jgi:ribonucleotide reductase beta subunit family protein with ferritin-like domain